MLSPMERSIGLSNAILLQSAKNGETLIIASPTAIRLTHLPPNLTHVYQLTLCLETTIMLKAVFLIALAGLGLANASPTPAQIAFASTSGTDAKVNVTLYVMSRCPDAVCPSLYTIS
jgi:hypothetical protein